MKPMELPPVLARLREHGYRVTQLGGPSAEFGLFFVDLSELRLRFSERTPCVWVTKAASSDRAVAEVADALRDLARARGWSHMECLALLEGEAPGLKKSLAALAAPRFVVADDSDHKKLVESSSVTHALLELLGAQIPLAALAPYQIGGPPTRNAFFGRAGEIGRIVRHPLSSFFVTGIRRIGKTWLLGEVRNRLLAEGQAPERLPWIDCSTLSTYEGLIEKLLPLVNPREFWRMQQRHSGTAFDLPAFMARMAALYDGPLTVFLDECDGLLAAARSAPALLQDLRAAATAGHCRFVLAGFQTLVDETTRKDSPLYLGFELLRLGPLSRDDTRELLLEPMASLRVRVADEEQVVARLYADTHGMPRLLQEYCIELVRLVEERRERTLAVTDIERVGSSEAVKALVVNAFRDSAEARDKLAVYALLIGSPEAKDKYTQEDMYDALQGQGCPASADDVDRSCDRLVLSGFLARDGRTFRFTMPLLPRLLRSQFNLAFLLKSVRQEVSP